MHNGHDGPDASSEALDWLPESSQGQVEQQAKHREPMQALALASRASSKVRKVRQVLQGLTEHLLFRNEATPGSLGAWKGRLTSCNARE